DVNNIRFCFCVNVDDIETEIYLESRYWPIEKQYEIIWEETKQPNLSLYFNMMYEQTRFNKEGDIATMIGDDMVFLTEGWETEILKYINEADGKLIVYCNDNYIAGEKLCSNLHYLSRTGVRESGTMEMDLIKIVSIIAAFVSFLFIVFLVSLRTERRLPNFMLAFFLFAFILDTLGEFNTEYLYPLSPVFGMLISLAVFFTVPAIYLFVKSSIFRDFSLSTKSLAHLLPYVGACILMIPGYFIIHLRGEFTSEYASDFISSSSFKLIYLSIYLQFAVYYSLIFIELRRYRQLLVENYSNPNMGNYRWLMQFVLLLLALDMIVLIRNIMRFSSSEVIFKFASLNVVINILIFVSWVLIRSLKEPGIFTGIISNLQLVKKMLTEGEGKGAPGNDANGTSESAKSSQQIKRIKDYMELSEPYLDSSLSMYDLASQLDMNVRELSLLINHTLNQHFFDFVNHYRIRKAMRILHDPENKQLTVLEVLYEVGFNSKSSFNTVFKKQTGMTPTQFRRSKSNASS
ncbi:MAG: AraC family transcriptional regulator, partial [Anaerolineales bacterium]|nr:AraC family transcriptional regulator [Anaerolineales bacterium]